MTQNTAKIKIIEKTVTPAGTAKWVWLEKPDTSEFGKNKYKCALVLDKGDDAAEAFVKKLRDLHKQHKGKADTSPVKDGDAMAEENEKYEALRGAWLISAKSKNAPGLVNSAGHKTAKAPRSGDLVKLAVALGSYEKGANKGVTLYLNAVQLLERRSQDGVGMFEDESSKFAPEADDAEADKPAETEADESDGDY
jgi:hypothetical protein